MEKITEFITNEFQSMIRSQFSELCFRHIKFYHFSVNLFNQKLLR